MLRTALVWLLLASVAVAQHAVWVVAPAAGPGVDFTGLQDAVDAADSFDTILVRAGTYGSFVVVDKSLSITADAGAAVDIEGSLASSQVVGLGPDGFLTLSGLHLRSQVDGEPALLLEDCAGSVWLDHCLLAGHNVPPSLLVDPPTPGLVTTGCSSVVLADCTLFGGAGLWGRTALQATGSALHLYGTSATGGSGQCDGKVIPTCGDGGAAASLTGGLLTAQSSTLTGGVPSPGNQVCIPFPLCLCSISTSSGAALVLDGSAQAIVYDTTLAAGPAHPPCGLEASSATIVLSGTLDESSGSPFVVSATSPQRVGDPAAIDFAGAPGDLAVALLAIFPLDVWLPKWHGPWLVGGNFQILVLGSVPAAGILSLPYVVPALPPGFESVEFIVQAARQSGEGTLLANVSRVILLAPGF